MTPAPTLPLLGFAAWSGTGKTTLLEQLIPLLVSRGLRLGCSSTPITTLTSTSRAKTATACARPAPAR